MNKTLSLFASALVMTSVAFGAHALGATGTAWSCSTSANNANATGYQNCVAAITSGTTATQLGRVTINPKQITMFTFGVSGSAVSALVTPTLSYYVGSRVMATQNVSVTSAGNIVVPAMSYLGTPLFSSVAISVSTPSTISATNGIVMGVQQNDK